MNYNIISNIDSCYVEIPHLFYYSHLVPIFCIVLLGFLVIFNKTSNSLAKKLLLLLLSLFVIWVFVEGAIWLLYDSLPFMFLWSTLGLLYVSIHIVGLYFFYVILENKDLSNKMRILLLILFVPIILLTPTRFNLSSFDVINCQAIESSYFIIYRYFSAIIIILSVLILTFKKYIKSKNEEKKKVLYIGFGVIFFLILFSWSEIVGSLTENFELTQYGFFGMPIFIAALTFSIIRFKTFNIKLLGAQALVWSLIILVGSQFFYQADMPTSSLILTAITLVLSAGIGLLVVRSVKKVDEQRELLDIANKNQESLLHFITHQIKGFMTKSKAIYAGILEGDYGETNGKVQAIVQYGLDSETKGVDTIQNILNASNLKSGKLVFDKKEFDLTAMVKSIIEDFRKKIADKGLELEENISSKPIMFNGDELRVKEVLKNLLDNSIHYTEQGKVAVTLKVLGDKIKYSIKDTGIGLSAVDKKNLFQEGGKGEVSLTHNVESTGYGLYIAKKIVEEHKGKVWAESAGRDKGSEFIVELPLK